MTDRILVAHASKNGSTTELAEAVASALCEEGLDVDVRPAAEVRSLDGYGAVVLGSAVYMGRWRRPAARLLRRRRRQLAERDVWLFSSGPVGEVDTADAGADRWTRPPRITRLAAAVGAHEHAVFGGAVVEGRGGPLYRKMAEETPAEARDLRDWDAVAAWAKGVAATLRRRPEGRAAA